MRSSEVIKIVIFSTIIVNQPVLIGSYTVEKFECACNGARNV